MDLTIPFHGDGPTSHRTLCDGQSRMSNIKTNGEGFELLFEFYHNTTITSQSSALMQISSALE